MLWAAIKATQQRYPKAICVVYTGDVDIPSKNTKLPYESQGPFGEEGRLKKDAILDKAEVGALCHQNFQFYGS